MKTLLLILSSFVIGAASGRAEVVPIEPSPVGVVIDGLKMSAEQKATAVALCERLGARLEIGKAPGGQGAFTAHSCTAGQAASPKSGNAWTLVMAKAGPNLRLTLRFNQAPVAAGRDGCQEDMGSQALPFASIKTEKQRAALVDDLAAYFLDQMPMVGRAEKIVPSAEHQDEWMTYRLGFDADKCLWVAEGAKATRDPQTTKGAWAHLAAGRGTRSGAAAGNLKDTVTVVQDKPEKEKKKRKSMFSGLIGGQVFTARLGLPVIRSNALLAKTMQIGLGLQINRGTYDGLTVAFDMVPKANAEIDGVDSSISWQRTSLGWAFRFNPGVVESVALTPHIGGWTFSSTLPQTTPDGQKVAETFAFDRAISVGVELSAVSGFGPVFASPHCGTDFAYALLRTSKTTVAAQRCGIDLSFHKLKTLGFFPYAFGNYEYVTIKDENTSKGAADFEVTERTVSYSEMYLGGGFTFEW